MRLSRYVRDKTDECWAGIDEAGKRTEFTLLAHPSIWHTIEQKVIILLFFISPPHLKPFKTPQRYTILTLQGFAFSVLSSSIVKHCCSELGFGVGQSLHCLRITRKVKRPSLKILWGRGCCWGRGCSSVVQHLLSMQDEAHAQALALPK